MNQKEFIKEKSLILLEKACINVSVGSYEAG